jgi:hypothetical protein
MTVESIIRSVVEGNVAVFYPCECDEHESGYEHFVDRLASALAALPAKETP